MKKLLLVSLCFLMLCVTQVFAQNRTITGTVTAKDDGLPLPGATVKVKGSNSGVTTNVGGKFTISVPTGGSITVSSVGYTTQTIIVGNQATINVVLSSAAQALGEVVVTGALGIKKAARETGYASTRLSNSQLTEATPVDIVNGLTGKAPGIVVQQTSDGVNPSLRINLRGSRSLNGYNQALIIVDGSPVSTYVFQNLNPNDIEDINILNGSGAAAIYGSQASNGALVVTTKRGTASGKPIITYENSLQLQQIVNFPQFQNGFGQYGGEGSPWINPVTGFPIDVVYENQQYGPAFDGSTVNIGAPINSATGQQLTAKYAPLSESPAKSFFQTGIIEQNSVSFRQGDAANNISISARDVYNKGYVPQDQSRLDNVRVSGDKTSGMFKIDFTAGYTKSLIKQEGNQGYDGSNLMSNIYQFPQELNINQFKDTNNPLSAASPDNYFSAYSINPWWIINNSRNVINKDQFQGSFTATLTPTKWLDLAYRVDGSFGAYRNKYTQAAVNWSAYAISNPFGGPLGGVNEAYLLGANGVKGQTRDYSAYGDGSGTIVNTGGDNPNYVGDQGLARLEGTFLLTLHHTFNDFKTSLILGNQIWSESGDFIYDSSSSLTIPGYYNIGSSLSTPTLYQGNEVIHQVSNFADLNLGYKNYLFLEGTIRNDNDSRLPVGKQSLWYPSAKVSFIPTELIPALKNGSVLDYAKFYLNLSKVGLITTPPYAGTVFSETSGFPMASSAYSLSTSLYPNNLKPQENYETEVGADLGFLKDRLHITAAYFMQQAKNQTLGISTSPSTGYTTQYVNAGQINSFGEEFSLEAHILQGHGDNFDLSVGGNLSLYNSKVVSLINGESQLDLGDLTTFQTTPGGVYAVVGKPYPQLLATDYLRDPQGRVIVNSGNGYPSASGQLTDEGTTAPKYDLGLHTTIGYSFVSLSVFAEYRGGNVMYNETGAVMDFGGTSAVSAEAGRQIFIYPNSVINTGTGANPVYTPNTTVPVARGGWEFWSTYPVNVGSPYVYSAAFWRIREADLNFNLNKFIKNNKVIKGLSVALTGRNLFLWVPKSNRWGDPELSDAGSTGVAIGSASSAQVPTPRVFGADLKVTF